MTAKTAEDRMRYAKQYDYILTSFCTPTDLLQLPPNKRIHVMKALSCLAIFTGRIEQWQQIRRQYQLSWSTGMEKIDVFTRFFDTSCSLDTMMQWLREAVRVLPSRYANLLLFCTLTGMRGSEAVESIRLLAAKDTLQSYYNPDRQILQHYLYPNIFIRRTKTIYISIVNDEIIGMAQKVGDNPSLVGLKKATRYRSLRMRMKYYRKIFASYLSQKGIQSEIIDLLQGRVPPSVFARNYLRPAEDLKDKVLQAVSELSVKL
jgi:hypothetical protein